MPLYTSVGKSRGSVSNSAQRDQRMSGRGSMRCRSSVQFWAGSPGWSRGHGVRRALPSHAIVGNTTWGISWPGSTSLPQRQRSISREIVRTRSLARKTTEVKRLTQKRASSHSAWSRRSRPHGRVASGVLRSRTHAQRTATSLRFQIPDHWVRRSLCIVRPSPRLRSIVPPSGVVQTCAPFSVSSIHWFRRRNQRYVASKVSCARPSWSAVRSSG